MNDTKTFSFSIDAAGHLFISDFRPRSLKKALECAVGDDWKKSSKKLLKSMALLPDVYAAVFSARQILIPQYIARYQELHGKVRELSAQGLKALELTKDGLPSENDLDAQASDDVFDLYAETRREALRCHRALSLMQKTKLTDWISRMDKTEFKVLSNTVKELLDREIRRSDALYSPFKDSSQGAALYCLMDIVPAATLKNFGFKESLHEGIPCAVIAERKAFENWCNEEGFSLTAETRPASVSTAKKTEGGSSRPLLTKKEAGQKKSAARSANKSRKTPAVKILKTEARLATFTPASEVKPEPSVIQKTTAGQDDAGDLASRLVQSLQLTPSLVEHRSPGRPRKVAKSEPLTAEETTDAEVVSTRPASRNRSGNHKA